MSFSAACSTGGGGFYTNLGGTLQVVADTETELPHDPGSTFDGFGDSSIYGSRVVFDDDNLRWIYLWEPPDRLTPVIVEGDVLDGKTVEWVSLRTESLSGDDLVFWVKFVGNEQALYLAHFPPPPSVLEVPTLGGAGLVALSLLLLAAASLTLRRWGSR